MTYSKCSLEQPVTLVKINNCKGFMVSLSLYAGFFESQEI